MQVIAKVERVKLTVLECLAQGDTVMSVTVGSLFLAALLVLPSGQDEPIPTGHAQRGKVLTVASDAAQAVTIKVRLLRRAPAGNLVRIAGSTSGQPVKTVAFRFEIEGAPADKTYQIWFQDMGMKADGLPPVPIPDDQYRFRVDALGNWAPGIPSFEALNFAKGEWMELRLKSTDGTVSRAVRFTPFQ